MEDAPMTGLPFIVFDVNETLLDLESLTPTFERIFGERSALRLWFTQLILYSEALTLAGAYVPFTDIGGAVLEMEAATRGISISAADRAELTEKFASMPPHPEVPGALRKLRGAGFRLFTLTNNTAEISGRQLKRAGLLDVFERRFSVDEVRRHKPAPEVYAAVVRATQTQPSNICLVACHTWDTLGAVAAGWQAALILRPGNALLDVGPQPQITGADLNEVAAKLIARYANQDQAAPA
jgi:2-haloacid dehalogenase